MRGDGLVERSGVPPVEAQLAWYMLSVSGRRDIEALLSFNAASCRSTVFDAVLREQFAD
jgi:hypothetical protein